MKKVLCFLLVGFLGLLLNINQAQAQPLKIGQEIVIAGCITGGDDYGLLPTPIQQQLAMALLGIDPGTVICNITVMADNNIPLSEQKKERRGQAVQKILKGLGYGAIVTPKQLVVSKQGPAYRGVIVRIKPLMPENKQVVVIEKGVATLEESELEKLAQEVAKINERLSFFEVASYEKSFVEKPKNFMISLTGFSTTTPINNYNYTNRYFGGISAEINIGSWFNFSGGTEDAQKSIAIFRPHHFQIFQINSIKISPIIAVGCDQVTLNYNANLKRNEAFLTGIIPMAAVGFSFASAGDNYRVDYLIYGSQLGDNRNWVWPYWYNRIHARGKENFNDNWFLHGSLKYDYHVRSDIAEWQIGLGCKINQTEIRAGVGQLNWTIAGLNSKNKEWTAFLTTAYKF